MGKRGTRLGFGHKRVYGPSLRSAVGRCRAMNRMRDLSDRKHDTRLNGNRPPAQSKRLQKKKHENAVRLQESVQSALYSDKSAVPPYPAGISLDSRAASGHPKDESGGCNAAVGLLDGGCVHNREERQKRPLFRVYRAAGRLLAAGGSAELDCAHKKNAVFISVIRLPDFITKTDFECAKTKEARKKPDFSAAFFTYEGIRCLRIRTL